MGKLSKRELKGQQEVFALLDKETLTEDEIERFYNEANEAFITDVTANSQYFTGADLALDFALMSVYRSGTILDLCAGAGVLSWAVLQRDGYNHDVKKIICLERDPKFVEIGQKLLRSNEHTEVVWICGDMFDKNLWLKILCDHGPLSCIYSNPPFGKVSKTDCDREWLNFQGADVELSAIEL